MEKAPRKPKQLSKEEAGSSSESCLNYDLFQNEERVSFLSASFQAKTPYLNNSLISSNNNGNLDITNDDTQADVNKTSIKLLPLTYLLASCLTLFGGIFSALQQRNLSIDASFPRFLELPFRKLHYFQIGIAVTCFVGIFNYLVTYFVWKQSKYSFLSIQSVNCFLGIASQICLFAFSILPAAIPNNLNLRSEDCILLNLYFVLSFLYQIIYIFCLGKSVPKSVKTAFSYQIRAAFFILCTIVFSFYLAGTGLSKLNIFPSEQMLENSNSICAFILFNLNNVFISLFYFDLKTVNLILKFAHIENVKSIRKCNQNIL